MTPKNRARSAKSRQSFCLAEALEPRRLFNALGTSLGFWNPNQDKVKLDYNNTGATNATISFGQAGDQVVAGAFAGNTLSGLADYNPSTHTWKISNNGDGVINQTIAFGNLQSIALAGDMTGNGYADLVTYNRNKAIWKVYDPHQHAVIEQISFGSGGLGIPLLGDFNNDGKDDLVLFNKGKWKVSYDGDGAVDATYHFGGSTGDVPVITDVNGDTSPDLGIFNNGTWVFDFNHDGSADSVYTNGKAGFTPLAGYFNSAGSIFVAPGGNGTGTRTNPFGSIQFALNAAGNGAVIRIAPGTYSENDYYHSGASIAIVGAGMDAVHITNSSGDAMFIDRDTNTYVYGIDFASADRGLVIAGGSVFLRGISTVGNVNFGALATTYLNIDASVDAMFCHFDGAVMGTGMDLQSNSTLNASNCTWDGNGTSSSLTSSDTVHGRGLAIEATSTVNLSQCDFSNNHSIALNSGQETTTTILQSTFENNVTADGAFVASTSRATFRNDTFVNNGPPLIGALGIEISNNYTGPGVIIQNNIFTNSRGAGVFVGNGSGIQITGNTFNITSNSGPSVLPTLGIDLNGFIDTSVSDIPINAVSTITGNTFNATGSATTDIGGIYALGTGAGGTIGGDGSLQNTFIGFPTGTPITITNFGGAPEEVRGDPTVSVLANNYSGTPNPVTVRHVTP